MSNNSNNRNTLSSSSINYDYVDDSWIPKIKRRRRFSTDETKILEGEYDQNSSPNQDKIQAIADIINTPRKIVTTWFQNRRAKNKRKEKSKIEEKSKRYISRRRSSTFSQEQDTDFKYQEDDTGSENNDENSPDVIYYGDNNSSSSQPSFLTLIQQELNDDMFDLSPDTGNLIVPYNQRHQREYSVNPTNNINQYYNPSQNNQQYSINIFNNMNNFYCPNELYEENFVRGTLRHSNIWNQPQLHNFLYYQNEVPFFMNNISNNRNMIPLPFNNFSSIPGINDDPFSGLYINPSDLFLNFHTTSQRHIQQRNDSENPNECN